MRTKSGMRQPTSGNHFRGNKLHAAIFVLLLLLIPFQTLLSMRNSSISGDEAYHIASGYSKLKTFDYRLFPEQGPLTPVISAFPLLFMNLSFPFDDPSWKIKNMGVLMPKFLFEYNSNPYWIIFWARVPMIILSMLLGFYVYLWARQLYGRKAGLFALFLYSFSPNMLAHAQLSSSDFGIAVFSFIAVYYLWKYLKQPGWKWLIAAGLTLGLAQLTKFSAIFLFPVYLAIFLFLMLAKDWKEKMGMPFSRLLQRFNSPRARQAVFLSLSFIVILALTYLVIVAAYRGEGMFQPLYPQMEQDVHLNKTDFPVKAISESSRFLGFAMSVPSPLPYYYVRGLGFSFYYSDRPQASLVVGDHLETRWYFFLLSFLLKTPLPELILLVASLIFIRRLARRPRDEACLAIPFLLFHAAFCFTQKQFGYRYLILTIPFLLVFVSKVVNLRFRSESATRVALAGIILLSCWYLISSISVYPHYLSYFNELAGGPSNGYRYFVGSNLDWGQDLFYLRDYLAEKGIAEPYVGYYGFPETVNYPISPTYIAGASGYKKLGCERVEGIVAISATNMMSDQNCYGYLLSEQPIERIGYTIFVYNLTSEE